MTCGRSRTQQKTLAQFQIRCLQFATEMLKNTTSDVIATTPPLDANRLLLSKLAQRRKVSEQNLKLMFIDITKTYFNAMPTRNIYVRVPKEMGCLPCALGRLVRCCYCTRGAGMLWGEILSASRWPADPLFMVDARVVGPLKCALQQHQQLFG